MKKLLLIDDTIEIQAWVADYLRNHGIHVRACANGNQAIKELKKDKYDIVVTDLRMPEEDGISVIYKMMNGVVPLNKKTPIIVITGAASLQDSQMIIQGLESLDIKVLHKPFEPEDILKAVCDALKIDIKDVGTLLTMG